MNNSTSPATAPESPNLAVSLTAASPLVRSVLKHIFSTPDLVAFHLDGTIPIETITPIHPPQTVDYRHGGYYQLDYVGGGTAEAYGDQILVMAGAA